MMRLPSSMEALLYGANFSKAERGPSTILRAEMIFA
jgi:hypothetical protein